jgi:hypothetical protein
VTMREIAGCRRSPSSSPSADDGPADRPAPGNAAALFDTHDTDAVSRVTGEDMASGQILADVDDRHIRSRL